MHSLSYLLITVLIITIGCDSKNTSTPPIKYHPVQKAEIKNNTTLKTYKDSIVIYKDEYDSSIYSKLDFDTIKKQFPELVDKISSPPDICYGIAETENNNHFSYSSEAGQDQYYLVYAYLLKQRNGDSKYQEQRIKLIAIYRKINEIFGRLAQGGTYFGHQYKRIYGYAEYSVHIYSYLEKYKDFKTYSITKQKQLYVASLKQLITDELNTTFDYTDKQKPQIKKELFETVDQISRLINNQYYLSMTQQFQYSNY